MVQQGGGGDATKIQDGIRLAGDGDTVRVMPGTYVENIDFEGRNIVLLGSGMENTIIDGNHAGSCVTIQSGETRDAVLEGFEITRGEFYGGAGIRIVDAEPTIRGNRITANSAVFQQITGSGGGIYILVSGQATRSYAPLIEDNIIYGNEAWGGAGGLYVGHTSMAVVRRNRIMYNRVWRGDGGGIGSFLNPGGHVTITDNLIEGNWAGDHGGGILAARGSWEIARNVIIRNQANALGVSGDSGGGITVGGGTTYVHHNTIVGNYSTHIGHPGGGISVDSGDNRFEQNVIAHSLLGGGVKCVSSPPVFRNNLFWNPKGEEDQDCEVDWINSGNLVSDPFFCDWENRDFTLAENSPALTHPAGPLGALPEPGCDAVATKPTTWGALKSLYGDGHE